jgi:hypothetical protein
VKTGQLLPCPYYGETEICVIIQNPRLLREYVRFGALIPHPIQMPLLPDFLNVERSVVNHHTKDVGVPYVSFCRFKRSEGQIDALGAMAVTAEARDWESGRGAMSLICGKLPGYPESFVNVALS